MPAPLGETALRRSVLFLSLPQGGGTGPGTGHYEQRLPPGWRRMGSRGMLGRAFSFARPPRSSAVRARPPAAGPAEVPTRRDALERRARLGTESCELTSGSPFGLLHCALPRYPRLGGRWGPIGALGRAAPHQHPLRWSPRKPSGGGKSHLPMGSSGLSFRISGRVTPA